MQFPSLFIIGLPKAGTTPLHDILILIQHKAIYGNSDYQDYLFFNSEERMKDIQKLKNGKQIPLERKLHAFTNRDAGVVSQ